MRSRYYARETERAHFVTSTIVDWLPVFMSSACCDILAGSLEYCRREKGLKLYAWVIMENHFHAVVQSEQLSRVMADLKKFTAGKLLAQMKEERREWLRTLLASGKAEDKTGSVYQVWQEGYHPQAIYSDQTMLQSRAERDRLRAEPQPEGCRRRAASTSITSMRIPFGADGSPRRSIGSIARRMSGCRARCRCCGVISGGDSRRGFGTRRAVRWR